MGNSDIGTLQQHLSAVKDGTRRFENAFEAVTRMIFEGGIEKVTVNSRTTYDFNIFRTGKKHPVGMYDEINSFVSFVKDAAEGGSSKEMAFVLVGEPGNGKTFFVEYLCGKYRQFIAKKETGAIPTAWSAWSGSAPMGRSASSSPRPMRTRWSSP